MYNIYYVTPMIVNPYYVPTLIYGEPPHFGRRYIGTSLCRKRQRQRKHAAKYYGRKKVR